MSKAFARWVIFSLAILVASFWGVYMGVPGLLWHGDASHISLFNLVWFYCSSIFIGYLTYRLDDSNWDDVLHLSRIGHFMAQSCVYIGLAGTATGFIIMMTTLFGSGVDFSNHSVMIGLISQMTSGMGTSLYTTATGVITTWLLSIQMLNLTQEISKKEGSRW